MELHAQLTRHAETAQTVEAALSRLEPAPGWRVLRAPGRLEAHWDGRAGAWARVSVRLAPRDDQPGGTLSVTIECSDHGDETIDSVVGLVESVNVLLAEAREA